MSNAQNVLGMSKNKYKNLGLPDELVKIYRKQKNYRTIKDNTILIKSCDHLKCFEKLIKSNKQGELMYETIIKNVDFVINEPGKVIYFPKDMITNMFFIFHGTVKVDKNQYNNFSSPKRNARKSRKYNYNFNKDDNNDGNIFANFLNKEKSEDNKMNFGELNKNIKKQNIKILGFYKKLSKGFQKNKTTKEKENKKYNSGINYYNDTYNNGIIYLKKGDEYGSEDIYSMRRKDLVECQTYCVIGFLSKHDWIYIFEKTDILKKNDLLNFLKTSKILKEVNNDVVINNIYNSIKEKRLFRGESLVKKGEKFDKIFIIRKGFFQVNLNVKYTINNLFNDLNYFGRFTMKEKSENIKYELKNCYYNNEKYKIVTYGEGEIIGDIEAHLGCNAFLTDVFCNTDSSLVYEITIEDFYSYSNKTMKEALNEEGKQKLQYYRERIHSITTINSKKLNNANKFKEIISNKLEEEKGHIFNRIENSSNGKLKYEKKQRKRLKSSYVNSKLKKILDQISVQQSTGLNINDFKYINYKNNTEKHNKYKIKFKKKPIEEVFYIFSTSIKNNELIKSNEFTSKDNKDEIFNKDTKDNKKNKDKSIANFETNNSQYVKTTTSYSKNYNTIKNLFKSNDKNINSAKYNKKISSGDIRHFNLFNSNQKNNTKEYKRENIFSNDCLNLKTESSINHFNNNNILTCKKQKNWSLNDKFQSIFSNLFQQNKNRNESKEEYDSLNYYNTQESTNIKISDTSKQNLIKNPKYRQYYNNKIFWSPKIETPRKSMSILTEIIKDQKDILFKKLSYGKRKDYSVKDKIFNK